MSFPFKVVKFPICKILYNSLSQLFCLSTARCVPRRWRCWSGSSCWCPASPPAESSARSVGCERHRPTCLYFQIEDGGLGVPRRAAPVHRRRERRHTATLRTAAAAVRSKNLTRCCPHQSLQWWVDLFPAAGSSDVRPALTANANANANAANPTVRSISYQEASPSWDHVASHCSSRGRP